MDSDTELTRLYNLKREVAILHKALNEDTTEQREIQVKTAFYIEKLIQFSRIKTDGKPHDPKELHALNLEIEAFNTAHPTSPDDLIRLNGLLG